MPPREDPPLWDRVSPPSPNAPLVNHSAISLLPNFSKYKMRKCVSCGQWMGHVLCLKGQSEQCVDCAVVPLQRPKLPPRPTMTQASSSAQCTCAVCVAKSYPYVGDASSSRASRPTKRNLTVSIPRRLIKLSHKSLTVSIPLKRLGHTQRKGLKVTTSRAHLWALPGKKIRGQSSVHPVIKLLARQYPQIKVLSFIKLTRYTPRQLLNLHKSKLPLSGKQGQMDHSAEIQPLQSENQSKEVKSGQPLQSEVNMQAESRQLLSSEPKGQSGKEVESREVYAFSPLLQILYDHTVGGKPNK